MKITVLDLGYFDGFNPICDKLKENDELKSNFNILL